ncbi:MAG: ATP-binding protein [Acidobacteriota bacterium]
MKQLWPSHVRTRLTLWYVAILAAVLVIYGGSTSAVLLYQMRGQLDHVAIEDLETVEGFFAFGPDGNLHLPSEYHDHPYSPEMQERFVEVRAEDGALLYRKERLGDQVLGGNPEPGEGVDSYSPRSVRLDTGTPVRVISRRHTIEGRSTLIRLGFSEGLMWQRFWQTVVGLLLGLPLALGLAGIGGYYLARRALRPVERMARRAHEIHAEHLGTRLEVENPYDELGLLGQAFNETLARLERSFEQLKRFTSDASHELRTPLTAIRSVGEVGLQRDGDSSHYREVIGSMLEEAGRLSRLVEGLLGMARADSGQVKLEQTSISVLSFVREATCLIEVLSEEKGQILSIGGDNSVGVIGDPIVLRRVVMNLLDNAIKYSPTGGRVGVRILRSDATTVAIEIEDNGPGIALEHREKIFHRFYRIDEGRSRDAGGAGLGLAIAKWGAEVHKGRLELDSSSTGCVFRLLLPLAVESLRDPAA